MFFHLTVMRIYLLTYNKRCLGNIMSLACIHKIALVSITRNNREPSSKTQAGVELSKDLTWVVKGCYVLLPDEHECVCIWKGMGLMVVKSRKKPNVYPFCFSHMYLIRNL